MTDSHHDNADGRDAEQQLREHLASALAIGERFEARQFELDQLREQVAAWIGESGKILQALNRLSVATNSQFNQLEEIRGRVLGTIRLLGESKAPPMGDSEAWREGRGDEDGE